MPHAALEYTNMLGCVPLPIKPLREQKNDIVPSAALYIDTLNQNLGRQVVGLEDGAAKLLMEYDYPCNRTQFKRILKKAVLETSTAYISRDTIEKILKEELEKLDERDREIMILRYGLNGVEELTQKDVAEKLKISQSYISRIEKKVIKRLKNVIKI